MVGVPGRSKGCNTCIQRKIRCDQETPLCGNCRKSNRMCTGYKRKLGYVLSRDVSLTNSAEPGRDETTVTYRGRWRKNESHQSLLATKKIAEAQQTWTEIPMAPSLCCQVSTNTALRQQFHYIFLNDHLPAEMLNTSCPISGVPMSWLLQLQEIGIQSPALESSTATFFAARVGRKKNDMNLVHQSRSMYVSGLERVQQALKNPKTRYSDETLAACMSLLLYELTERPAGASNGFLTHQKGAMMILELRGPDASATPLGHGIFLQLRSQAILGSLVHRRDTFLSRPEWMERPWKSIIKTPFDHLQDACFVMSDIFQQFDKLSHETDRNMLEEGLRDVIAKFLKIGTVMQDVFGEFEKSVSGPLYWPELSTLDSCLDDKTLGKVFPVSFYFPTFAVAQVTTAYWSGTMAVHNQLMYTYIKLSTLGSSTASSSATASPMLPTATGNDLSLIAAYELRILEHDRIWRIMAMNICQSAEYFLQEKMGEFSSLNLITLLSGCYSCVNNSPDDFSRELRWIAEMIERIKTKANLPVYSFLPH